MRSGDREVVGSKERTEVFDLEEVADGGESGGVWEFVIDERVAGAV